MKGVDKNAALATLDDYNSAVKDAVVFDSTSLDGKGAIGLELPKSHWAQKIDTGPFRALPVTLGITFTYGGLKVDSNGRVRSKQETAISGPFARGELVGGVFFGGYPGG